VKRSLAAAAPLFAALGDPTRMLIVARLCERGPQSIARLTHGSAITRQAVTKHLHALSKAGLLRSQRAGRERVWSLEATRLAEVRRYLEQISEQWDRALGRLRSFVEED